MRTVYNRTAKEVVEIVEGRLLVVPPGTDEKPGTLVVCDPDAAILLERRPAALSAAAEVYTAAEVAQCEGLGRATLLAFCQGLMRGVRPEFASVLAQSAEEGKKGSRGGAEAQGAEAAGVGKVKAGEVPRK